ncbi:MAG: mechanosensitive ion channel family protein [Chloroflexi bacterium]|nr:mechanosensitive ion channel family protein [Chloroflexota bacterium]
MAQFFESTGIDPENLYLTIREALVVGIIFVIAVIIIHILKIFFRKISARCDKTETMLDNYIVEAVDVPVYAGVFLLALYLSSRVMTTLMPYEGSINKFFVVLGTLWAVYAALKVFNSLLRRYQEFLMEHKQQKIESHLVKTVGQVISAIVWGIAIILILDQMGYNVNALIASMGIGGIAVALAAQDTLSNFLAGFYLMLDRPLRVGDYIKLSSGEEGFVEEIGWRTTKIRQWANNIVVIPNASLSKTVFTNCYQPEQTMPVHVQCGVGYDSDLEKVEKAAVEEAVKVMQCIEGADTSMTPVLRFKEFSDSNINFFVTFHVKDFAAQYLLSHEYMKALYKRFKEEGIRINS